MSDWQPMHPLPPVFPFAWACRFGEDVCGLWQAFEVAGERQVMRWIPPRDFVMGSPRDEPGRQHDERRQSVRGNDGFWLAETPCTRAMWTEVIDTGPNEWLPDAQIPAVHVSWLDVTQRFLPALRQRAAGFAGRLPTEAQWECACRAGTTGAYVFGEHITEAQVNFGADQPVPVFERPANRWGLFQMHGNVKEWCSDARADQAFGETSGSRVVRGGAYESPAQMCRSASRQFFEVVDRLPFIGFRLAHPATLDTDGG